MSQHKSTLMGNTASYTFAKAGVAEPFAVLPFPALCWCMAMLLRAMPRSSGTLSDADFETEGSSSAAVSAAVSEEEGCCSSPA